MTLKEFVERAVGDRKVVSVSSGSVTSRTSKKVHTMRGVQHHSGYYGYVLVTFEGVRRPETVKCCFHKKPKAAREHAESMSRAFARLIPRDEN